jgi:ABC-type oligopeptide transport system ATPase subunit
MQPITLIAVGPKRIALSLEVYFLMNAAIETRGLEFSYVDGTKALVEMNIAIPAGKRVAFLGPNGAGKTTLFLHFNGLIKPDQGKVYVAGQEVRYDRASLLEVRKKVGIVFQDPDTQLFSSTGVTLLHRYYAVIRLPARLLASSLCIACLPYSLFGRARRVSQVAVNQLCTACQGL